MHIVFVTTELATIGNSSGGLATFTANMARIFANNGHRVTIVVASVRELNLIFDDNISLEITYIDKVMWGRFDRIAHIFSKLSRSGKDEIRRFLDNLYRSKQVFRTIQKINSREKIDLIHYCNLSSLALWADKSIPHCIRISSFLNICRGADLPIAKLGYNQNKPTIKEKLIDYTLRKARYVIAPSNLISQIALQELGIKANVLESPFILDKDNWEYQSYYNCTINKKEYILHYGSLKYLKGTNVVAGLVHELLSRHSDLHLVLAGNSEDMLDDMGNKIKAHELVIQNSGVYSDRVIYVGRLVRQQLYPIIQNAKLCLLPSRIENLSNACIEAMAMGKIVVATEGASYEQLIEDGVNGYLRERDNPDSFLEGIEEALSLSEEEKEAMSENAKRTVERLNPDNIYKQYLSYYQKVIEEW